MYEKKNPHPLKKVTDFLREAGEALYLDGGLFYTYFRLI